MINRRRRRVVEGPAACHGWTVFAVGDDGRHRCLYCLQEATEELARDRAGTPPLGVPKQEDRPPRRRPGVASGDNGEGSS